MTKAVVTGPSGFQLMKSKNIDPKSQRLYGPKGLFGGIFDADIDIGIKWLSELAKVSQVEGVVRKDHHSESAGS